MSDLSVQTFVIDVVAALLIGLVAGAGLAYTVATSMFAHIARYEKTGSPEPIVRAASTAKPGIPVNSEESARRQIAESSIERGALEVFQVAQAEGVTMTMKEARKQAREMLTASDPLGGAR